jgi:mono/diheme cytochrome c family protein
MRLFASLALLIGCCGAARADEAATAAPSRGELLYNVHCNACHDTKRHLREKKLAVDWPSLVFQVDRWQDYAKLGWSMDDVSEVAHYLNREYYHYPNEPAAD